MTITPTRAIRQSPPTTQNDAFARTILIAYVVVVLPALVAGVFIQSAFQSTARRASHLSRRRRGVPGRTGNNAAAPEPGAS
ncbi:hypothetical protein ABC304_13405 [Microbacterium sp. 1P10UB]|uniref:hypothetical protein n=1 Tax=unclassified Microbacterium TaxID=2609290 RepID=UPI0039A07E2C